MTDAESLSDSDIELDVKELGIAWVEDVVSVTIFQINKLQTLQKNHSTYFINLPKWFRLSTLYKDISKISFDHSIYAITLEPVNNVQELPF